MIRILVETDYDALIDLWVKAGLDHRPLGRDSRESIRLQMEKSPDAFWGYFIDSKLVGSVLVTDDGRKGWINRLAVLPEARHQGIAKQLVDFSEKLLLKRGIKIFCALIESQNAPSLNLFDKMNYELIPDIVYLRRKTREGI